MDIPAQPPITATAPASAASTTTSPAQLTLDELQYRDEFIARHVGPNQTQIRKMLDALGVASLAELIRQTVPSSIALQRPLALGKPCTEHTALATLKTMAQQNLATRSFIGLGYHDTITPNVILRNVLENPGWYTAYTPYQPEISQGRLETLLTFQQMILDLTGMDLANASLLDEATAAAEAMALAKRVSKSKSNLFFVDQHCLPQTIDVLKTRAASFGFELLIGDVATVGQQQVFGAIFQYPNCQGELTDLSPLVASLHEQDAIAIVAADLMSLILLKSPGEMGADVVLGTSQRFGVPMGYGGPHAAYFATREAYKRAVPGRIIGVSVDARGKQAYRMSLQTREQHIRREKANSNICTAQVLLANISALYAMYHGPDGLTRIARRIHRLTCLLAHGLRQAGMQPNSQFFDTLSIALDADQRAQIIDRALSSGVNLRTDDPTLLGLSLDECSTPEDVSLLWHILLGAKAEALDVHALDQQLVVDPASFAAIPAQLQRNTPYLQHPVFTSWHSETDMLRYLKRLENRDLSLTHAMIPLGSCTMKLNATAEMIPISWPEFSKPHPFAPRNQTLGYAAMISELEAMLAEITGFDAISMQPNSGAQGEYAGLLAIRNYLDSKGETARNVCLIPSSAHGTNPASAQMASMKVVVVACDEDGNIDVDDLRLKASQHSSTLAALMITYPSTHGVYEEGVKEVCALIHEHGGQVYMDGANLNAQVGLTRPGDIGADVSHVNLHKTFCIPHGGGGPGMGPIGVKKHLAPFLANHKLVPLDGPLAGNTAVSAAPWGSAGILPISWAYIKMMGASGLRYATELAILNANYIAARLSAHYPVLYTGRNGRVAHECIIDLRPLKASSGISEEDVAKRLMDYGFHAPTMSFPVAGTLMIEPTESESLPELDRFIEAMIAIRQEIARVESGALDAEDNPLKQAPHTLADIMDEHWNRGYGKQEAAFPVPGLRDNKFWPSVNRIDNVYGDRNLFCACPAMENYQ
ncbi:MAG: aminomethyl-transferring glycine dehydrogenase [Pseudomonadales bacterium]|nr:aminomethyl-transferring glycine dehydrogenase [Pseudomonadales bacterium]